MENSSSAQSKDAGDNTNPEYVSFKRKSATNDDGADRVEAQSFINANGKEDSEEHRGENSARTPRKRSTSPTKLPRGEKQIKPNKVYIGGLPEHTRQEDLQNCFGKIGNIEAIELKLGYGFVKQEFDSREAAEESVAKYHEGYFMGNKIRVELSHGGGRTAKYSGEPGACFKCGQQGHWARECPTSVQGGKGSVDGERRPLPPGGYPLQRDLILPRMDYPPSGRYYPAPPALRDGRYGQEVIPPREYRDYRSSRPSSPPREYRDYGPPPMSRREYDEYRVRGPPPAAHTRYESRVPFYPPENGGYRETPPASYSSRSGYASARDPYERRGPPPDRYAYSSTSAPRPRTPPGVPARTRDDYERIPPRDYQATLPDYRGRASPRPYADDRARYRRRSQSPVQSTRAGASYPDPHLGYPVDPSSYAGVPRISREDYRSDRNGRP